MKLAMDDYPITDLKVAHFGDQLFHRVMAE